MNRSFHNPCMHLKLSEIDNFSLKSYNLCSLARDLMMSGVCIFLFGIIMSSLIIMSLIKFLKVCFGLLVTDPDSRHEVTLSKWLGNSSSHQWFP